MTEGPAQWLSPSLLACKATLSPGDLVVTGTLEELAYDNGEGSTYDIGTQTATFSQGRMLRPIRLKGCGAIVDFQTGGPTMSPLLLIYMYLEIKCGLQKEPFCPASHCKK